MNCPICQSGSLLYSQILCQNAAVLGDCFPPETIAIAVCAHCGLTYLRSGLTQSAYSDYYAEIAKSPVYYEMFGEEESNSYFEHIYQILKNYLRPDRTEVLDVAGGWGELGAYLAYVDPGIQMTVLDLNRQCLNACAGKGLHTLKADIAAPMDRYEPLYDVVIANHALEHIRDLRTAMGNIRALLKDDGIFYVEVPDASKYSVQDTPPFYFATLEHVVHFTIGTLEHLVAVSGFEIVDSGTCYKKVSKYPSVWAVLKKKAAASIHVSKNEGQTIEEYLNNSTSELEKRLFIYKTSQRELILWGIGASTVLFLNSFANCNVVGLVDANKHKQGTEYVVSGRNLRIEDPASVAKRPGAGIFVLSGPYKDVIERQIHEMGFTNEVFSW